MLSISFRKNMVVRAKNQISLTHVKTAIFIKARILLELILKVATSRRFFIHEPTTGVSTFAIKGRIS